MIHTKREYEWRFLFYKHRGSYGALLSADVRVSCWRWSDCNLIYSVPQISHLQPQEVCCYYSWWKKGKNKKTSLNSMLSAYDKEVHYSRPQSGNIKHINAKIVSIMSNSKVQPTFISVGATRHPSASQWDKQSGILAFAAGRTIAVWQPEVLTHVQLHQSIQKKSISLWLTFIVEVVFK